MTPRGSDCPAQLGSVARLPRGPARQCLPRKSSEVTAGPRGSKARWAAREVEWADGGVLAQAAFFSFSFFSNMSLTTYTFFFFF